MKLTAEALEEWRDHPVTEFLLSVLRKGEASNRQALKDAAWESGTIALDSLGRAKAAQQLIEDLATTTADEWNEWSNFFDQKRERL